ERSARLSDVAGRAATRCHTTTCSRSGEPRNASRRLVPEWLRIYRSCVASTLANRTGECRRGTHTAPAIAAKRRVPGGPGFLHGLGRLRDLAVFARKED